MRNLAARSTKPVCISWPSPPRAVAGLLAAHGIYSFVDAERGIRALAQWVGHGAAARRPPRAAATRIDDVRLARVRAGRRRERGDLRSPRAIGFSPPPASRWPPANSWRRGRRRARGRGDRHAGRAEGHHAEDHASREGRPRRRRPAHVSPTCASAWRRFQSRATDLAVTLDGVLVQKMRPRGAELLVTAFRDPMFGVMVTCGSGGGLTELVDDVVTERAPVGYRTRRAHARAVAYPASCRGRWRAAARRRRRRNSSRASPNWRLTAPWQRFVFEVNPVAWRREDAVALDGLLIVN